MTEEKQIEEMAHVLCGQKCGCGDCKSDFRCGILCECSILVKAGYRKQVDRYYVEPGKPPVLIETSENRKQTEGEWVKQERKKGVVSPEAVCSNCGREVVYQVKDDRWAFEEYCPHCGAKMKGGE